MEEVKDKLESVKTYGVIRIQGQEAPEGWLDADELFASDKDVSEPEVEVDGEDIATLMYTSGTEARPKIVRSPT